MAIEIKVTQAKPWKFYISNGAYNIRVNVGRELGYALGMCVRSDLQLCFRGKPITPNRVITDSQWNGELDKHTDLPTLFIAAAAIIMFKSSEEDTTIITQQMSLNRVKGGIKAKDLMRLLPKQYVLVFYPDTFVVWDKHSIIGLNLINPDASIKDLI